MKGYKKHSGGAEPIREVFVARTVSHRDKATDRFVQVLGNHFGSTASIKTLTSLHLTIRNSAKINTAMAHRGYSHKDIREFRGGLEQELKSAGFGDIVRVTVNPDKPFGVFRRHYRNLLGLVIVVDDGLIEQRRVVDGYVKNHLGIPSPT